MMTGIYLSRYDEISKPGACVTRPPPCVQHLTIGIPLAATESTENNVVAKAPATKGETAHNGQKSMLLIAFITALGLAAIHIFAGRIELLKGKSRKVWLSAGGGISVAFVFLHLLPELASRQRHIENSPVDADPGFLDAHVYLLALAGLTVFYGLERFAKRPHIRPTETEWPTGRRTFWAHLASFAVYNVLIGYLLFSEAHSLQNLVLYAVAIAPHVLVIDFSFQEHYQNVYHDKGRWLLAAAVMTGWAIGMFADIPKIVMSVAIAFVAGGIILNTLKEELPEEKQSRFWPFLLGIIVYTFVVAAQTE